MAKLALENIVGFNKNSDPEVEKEEKKRNIYILKVLRMYYEGGFLS